MALRQGSLIKSSTRRGMMFDVSDHDAPNDAVRFIDNMLPDPIGALTSRNGRTRRQDTAIGDLVYDVFRWLASDSSYRDIVAHKSGSNMIYGHADGSGSLNNTVTGLTLGNPVIGMQKKFRLYLNNGNDATKVYVFDSTVQTRDVGVGNGPAVTAAFSNADGSLENSQTYGWKISVIYGEDGETNGGTEDTQLIAAPNQRASLSWSAPTPPAGMAITAYRIWRKKNGGTNGPYDYRLVAQVSSGTTTYEDYGDNSTTSDDQRDVTVSTNQLLHDNHNAPPTKLTGMIWWDYENIAVGWGEKATVGSDVLPNRLFFSELGKSEIWKTLQDSVDATNTAEFQDVPQESQDNPIVSCVAFGPFLYVFNRFGVRVLTPTNVARAYKVDMVANSADHGIIGPKAVTVTDSGDIYYVSTDGFRQIRGRIDIEVSPNTDAATQSLVSKPGVSVTGESVNSIIRGVPESLRQYVYAHEFRDRVHISLATDVVSQTTPTLNNDVLIFNIAPPGFYYSSNRRVYGWATVNDSGNPYALLGCGYTIPDDAPTTTKGNVWREYVPSTTTDQDADGNSVPISWFQEDFNRAIPGFNAAKLRDVYLDASATNAVITMKMSLDAGRLTSTKQFTFTTANRTAWQDASFWQSDPANALSNDADYGTGIALSNLVALFSVISDGEFRLVKNGGNKDVTGRDFTSVTTIEDVVSVINAGLIAVSAACHCDYIKSPGVFRFTADDVGSTHSVTNVQSVPGGSGTDIATAALLGDGANEVEHQAVNVSSPFIGLEWWASTVADPTASKHFWSSGQMVRGKPMRAMFYGERAQMVSTSVSSTSPATIYGYRTRYHLLPPTAAGVT